MTNASLARNFRELATVMEYLGENAFKFRSYARAADAIKKADVEMAALSHGALVAIPHIGDAIATKIRELVETGQLTLLARYQSSVPAVATELLRVKGFGPAKVRQLVTELELDSIGDLLHAIEENRVVSLKGFSTLTQAKLKAQLDFYQRSLGQLRLPEILGATKSLVAELQLVGIAAVAAGPAARHCPTATGIAALAPSAPGLAEQLAEMGYVHSSAAAQADSTDIPYRDYERIRDGVTETVRLAEPGSFGIAELRLNSDEAFLDLHPELAAVDEADDAAEVFAKAKLPFTTAPQRERESPWPPVPEAELVRIEHIRGLVHAHTRDSDGSADLHTLATATRDAGFGYLTITDHSRAAGYAHGLDQARLAAQGLDIEDWNRTHPEFLVIRGTECDILRDGSLDFDYEVLSTLDIVIASVHSVLTMTREDATARILRAIENPYVTMLGHPTGRLLLSRAGYDLDIEAVLAACAQNQVAVEINANPMRLDLDWRHLPLARELGVKISINPDAHSTLGIHDVRYGVLVAQKAGLRPADCLNCLEAPDFLAYLREQRRRRLSNHDQAPPPVR